MPEPTSSPHSAGAILEKAEGYTRSGRYPDAIRILEHAGMQASVEHPKYWEAMVCTATARNKLHAQDDQGATEMLGRVAPELRAANPKIDAECHTIIGILQRRNGYRAWKNGHRNDALQSVQHAIAAFALAEKSAEMGLEERLRQNAVLNRLYAQGLQYAIDSTSRQYNAGLLVDAIVAETCSRASTPVNLKDELTGLTIVADLALGGGIETADVSSLSERPEFQSAWRSINGCGATWAQLLLDHVRNATAATRPDVIARALLLGAKLLDRGRGGKYDADTLSIQYATWLRRCYLDLNGIAAGAAILGMLEDALRRFPEDVLHLVMSPRFLR